MYSNLARWFARSVDTGLWLQPALLRLHLRAAPGLHGRVLREDGEEPLEERDAGGGHPQLQQEQAEQAEGGEDVCLHDCCIRYLLASLPCLLHLLLPQPPDHEVPLHQEHLPQLLLASHGQLCGQPHHLLLDEQQVGC